ncbi:MAG: hypothetical protein HZC48_03505 [Nitrospirae bacterium]|nr:hypothetical protein [Nitrospirota bacterium]
MGSFFRTFVAVLFLVLSPVIASAVTLSGESRTYLTDREAFDSSRLIPLYEYLDFNLDGIEHNDVSFHFGGWLSQDLADKSFDKRFDRDIQYAYLSLRKDTSNTIANLGRLMVFEGVAAEHVDGIYAKTDLQRGFAVSGYAGSPVETDYLDGNGDFIYGARLSHGIPDLYQVGFSYLKENGDASFEREEEGVDLWYRPADKIQLVGKSSYSSEQSDWQDHSYKVAIGPFSGFTITPMASWINYKTFFSAATSGAFRFSPDIIDPDEKALIVGADGQYTMNSKLIVTADYKNCSYDIAGTANYYGGKLSYKVFESSSVGLGFHRMDGDTERLKYNEYRAYVHNRTGKFDVVLDSFFVKYDEEINIRKTATSVLAGIGYDISRQLRLEADASYSRNPYYDKDIRGFFKLIYKFDIMPQAKKGV